jgi:hypothetical protein
MLTVLTVAGTFPHSGLAQAETAEAKGRRIAEEADRRNNGWGDTVSVGRMILRDRQGQTSVRIMRILSLEGENDSDKSVVVFNHPPDIDGTALLTHSHKDRDDDQWLFLPALKRVKRISSSNKSGSFVGSEFSYEDMSNIEIDKYKFRFLRDETFEGQETYVVERTPLDENSGYTKQIAWIDKEHYRTLKVDFYDRKESHLKTLISTEYKQYLDKYWRAHKLEMVNHQTGKSTELLWQEYKFRQGLSERDFTQTSLQRIR